MASNLDQQDTRSQSQEYASQVKPGEKPDYGYVALKFFIDIGIIGGIALCIAFVGWFLRGIWGALLFWITLPFGVLFLWVAIAYIPLHFRMMRPLHLEMTRAGVIPNLWKSILQNEEFLGDVFALDVGCGTGDATIKVAKALPNARVVGIDIFHGASGSSPAPAQRNALLEGVGDRVEIKEGSVLEIPYPDNTFDVVTSSSVLHDVHSDNDKVQAVREIHRVLKPGGIFIMLELFRDVRMWCSLIIFSPVWKPEKFWHRLLDESDLKLEKVEKHTKFLNYGFFIARKYSSPHFDCPSRLNYISTFFYFFLHSPATPVRRNRRGRENRNRDSSRCISLH